MAVYTIFKSLGLRTQVRAILDLRRNSRSESLNAFFEAREELMEENAHWFHNCEHKRKASVFSQGYSAVGSLGGCGASDALDGGGEDMEDVVKQWVRESDGSFMKIVWVNQPHHSGLDMVHLTASSVVQLAKL